ncbi:hypothetical protein MJO28_010450 [Puccinia striiformis f. sp. tritici]|uniref:Uncharacterized protein n=1 Tax=Puccinia striiformis f. sp. tritici TaxID=168172 RepID=A0ACC0E6Q2_9BASI|nr:hypothetical protein MJO28_010450 [Puccinia striiformis f. sp. tritici]
MDQDIPQKLVDMEKDEPLRMHNSFMWLKATKFSAYWTCKCSLDGTEAWESKYNKHLTKHLFTHLSVSLSADNMLLKH